MYPTLGGYNEPETLRYEITSDVPWALTGDTRGPCRHIVVLGFCPALLSVIGIGNSNPRVEAKLQLLCRWRQVGILERSVSLRQCFAPSNSETCPPLHPRPVWA